MSSEYFALIGIGFILALLYMALGIGTTRAIAKMKGRDIRIFEVFFWPIVLCVIAAMGDVE